MSNLEPNKYAGGTRNTYTHWAQMETVGTSPTSSQTCGMLLNTYIHGANCHSRGCISEIIFAYFLRGATFSFLPCLLPWITVVKCFAEELLGVHGTRALVAWGSSGTLPCPEDNQHVTPAVARVGQTKDVRGIDHRASSHKTTSPRGKTELFRSPLKPAGNPIEQKHFCTEVAQH